ncbi:DNA replication protein [Proteus terrae]|uniref:DNA replication protein n=1 Tax=Proteus terrae TaxID=1574161 RepID=UPI000D6929D1|nr:DNA replication protein [Proteus terrae]
MSNVSYALQERIKQPVISGKGFAFMHRKIMECDFYKKDSEAVHLWLHLIMTASHQAEAIDTDVGQIVIGRGQMMRSRPVLTKETGIQDNKIRSLLRSFSNKGMISVEAKSNKISIITVLKYDEYQGKNCPEDVRRLSEANTDTSRLDGDVCPEDVRRLSLYNNNTNTTSKDVVGELSDESHDTQQSKINSKKSPPVPYQAIIDAYHEILPEMARIQVVRGTRKNKIRSFWQKCNSEYMSKHNKPFTLENWKGYLSYISANCRWMTESRPNGRGGFWRAKNLDYLITDECYTSVKEDRANDRK